MLHYPHHNMLGVYYLPVLYAASDLKLSVKKVQTTLKKLCDISYCRYDAKTQYIWVCNTALEQFGVTAEEISTTDNRIKAIQAIWNSLPIQVDFLPDVYNKYNKIFNLKSRFDSLAVVPNEFVEPNLNIETPADTTDLNKEPSIDDHHSSIPSAINLTTLFEGALKPLQSPPAVGSAYNFCKANVAATTLEGGNTFSGYCFSSPTYLDTAISTQKLFNKVIDKNEGSTVPLLKGLTNPFQAPSIPLQSPSEAPLEALRSNIEDISKNIEEINKKKEKEENKKTNNALFSSSATQMQPYFEKPPEVFNSSFLKITKNLEEKEKTEAVDAKKQLTANKIYNLPVVTIASELETNSASVFSAPVVLEARNNAVAPIVYNGSVISVSRAIAIIFEYWKKVMGYPEAELDYDRKNWISRALQKHSIAKLCEAIIGCSRTPRNMGENDHGERYDDLHVIFKNNAQIERFVRNSHHPPIPDTEAKKRLRGNTHEINSWLKSREEKLNESKEQL
ncbi:MAG: hypothetical protein WCH10_05485 [bacterium]